MCMVLLPKCVTQSKCTGVVHKCTGALKILLVHFLVHQSIFKCTGALLHRTGAVHKYDTVYQNKASNQRDVYVLVLDTIALSFQRCILTYFPRMWFYTFSVLYRLRFFEKVFLVFAKRGTGFLKIQQSWKWCLLKSCNQFGCVNILPTYNWRISSKELSGFAQQILNCLTWPKPLYPGSMLITTIRRVSGESYRFSTSPNLSLQNSKSLRPLQNLLELNVCESKFNDKHLVEVSKICKNTQNTKRFWLQYIRFWYRKNVVRQSNFQQHFELQTLDRAIDTPHYRKLGN